MIARALLAFGLLLAAASAQAQSVIAQLIAGVDPRAVAVNPVTNRIYVANENSNTVTVIDGATHATTTLPVGSGPQHIAINTATNKIFVANGRSASLAVIDGATNAVTVLPVGGSGPIVINQATNKIYMARMGNADEVTVIDGASLSWYTMAIDSYVPVDLDINPATQLMYVVNYATGDLRIVDLRSTSDFPPTSSIGMWSKPVEVAVNRTTNRVYVITEDSRGPIAVIDANTNHATTFLTPAGHASGPRALAINERTNKVYAAFNGEVIVIDGATNALGFVQTGASAIGLAINPDTNRIYAPNGGGSMTVIDGASNATVNIAIPAGARAIALNPATNRAYVVGSAGVTVIEGGAAPPPPPPVPNDPAVNAQGLWWASPAGVESGWGVNLTHQGDTLFGTWFTYDTDGSGMWLVMSNGARTATNTYSGELYRTSGPPFNASPFDPAQVTRTPVGTATFTFTDANTGVFTAAVNGVTVSKPITRQVFSTPVPACSLGGAGGASPNYQDLWWRSPAGSESGWGLNIAHQGDILFVTWFTYGANGKGLWLVGSNVARVGTSTYSGALYRATGPAFNASPWRSSQVALTQAGTITITFNDAANATVSYVVDGLSQAKTITRQVYSLPATVCR